MRYLGGKFRIGRKIAEVVAPRGVWWEPFCGGLNVSRHLAAYGPGLVSDSHAALIAMYLAVRGGWEPPESVSREEYAAARALPDSDPRKAFCGFACSFSGDWFKGYAGAAQTRTMNTALGPRQQNEDPVRAARTGLTRDLRALSACDVFCADFLSEPVCGLLDTIYCDPPYAGTTSYGGVAPFDHTKFWTRCQEWAATGARVFVSEYACPVPHEIAHEQPHRDRIRRADMSQTLKIERVFRILPLAVRRASPSISPQELPPTA